MPRPAPSSPARAPGRPTGRATGRRVGTLLAAAGLLGALLAPVAGPGAAVAPAAAATAGDRSSPTAPAAPSGPAARAVSRAGSRSAAQNIAQAPDTELTITVGELTPGVLEQPEAVRISGTVANGTDQAWTDVALYATRPLAPITDAAGLVAAADSDPATYIGDRIIEPDAFATIDRLEPGGEAGFEFTVSAEQLGLTDAGVYLIGVQAIGDSAVPRDEFADGRTRFFLPLVPDGVDDVRTAVVVPVRARVGRTADGRVADLARWARSLQPGGRLSEVLAAGAASGAPVTWLVDPAVLDAVTALAAGNPPVDLAAGAGEEDADGGEGSTPTADPSATPADPDGQEGQDGNGEAGSQPDPEEVAAAQTAAQVWLQQLSSALAGRDVLALPYGDLDVSAAAEHDPGAYARARSRSTEVMERLGIASTPVLSSPDGYLSADAVVGSGAATLALADRAAVSPAAPAPDSVVTILGHTMVLTSGDAAESSGEGTRRDPVAVRQRLLSDAAIRALTDNPLPLVQALPPAWSPLDGEGFLTSLDAPWLDVVPLREIASASAPATSAEALVYPPAAQNAQVEPGAFSATNDLLEAATLLDGVLGAGGALRQRVADDATTATSYSGRDHPIRSVDQTRAQEGYLAGLLGSIRVEAPPGSTLSSTSGNIGATVVNGLDRPVTVRVSSQSDGQIEVSDSAELRLAPRARTRLLLQATTTRPGVHDVRLVVTDADGNPLGSSSRVTVRAAQVSGLIWVIIAAGLAMLFSAIAVRIVRRVRASRAEDAAQRTAGEPGT